MHHPTDRIAHTTAFVTPVMEHWLERETAQWVHNEGSIRSFLSIGQEKSKLQEGSILFNHALNIFS